MSGNAGTCYAWKWPPSVKVTQWTAGAARLDFFRFYFQDVIEE